MVQGASECLHDLPLWGRVNSAPPACLLTPVPFMASLFIVGVSVVFIVVHVYVDQSCRACVKVAVLVQQHSPPGAVGLTFPVGLAVMREPAVYPLMACGHLLQQPLCGGFGRASVIHSWPQLISLRFTNTWNVRHLQWKILCYSLALYIVCT